MRIFPKENSYRIGLMLAAIHLCISWWVIFDLASSDVDAGWQFIWLYFWLPDFPVTLLWMLGCILFPDWNFPALGPLYGDFRGFLLPAFVFGIVAPAWYFFLPSLIVSLRTGSHEHIA